MTDETDEGSLRGLRAVTSRANERGRLLPRPAWVGVASERERESEREPDGATPRRRRENTARAAPLAFGSPDTYPGTTADRSKNDKRLLYERLEGRERRTPRRASRTERAENASGASGEPSTSIARGRGSAAAAAAAARAFFDARPDAFAAQKIRLGPVSVAAALAVGAASAAVPWVAPALAPGLSAALGIEPAYARFRAGAFYQDGAFARAPIAALDGGEAGGGLLLQMRLADVEEKLARAEKALRTKGTSVDGSDGNGPFVFDDEIDFDDFERDLEVVNLERELDAARRARGGTPRPSGRRRRPGRSPDDSQDDSGDSDSSRANSRRSSGSARGSAEARGSEDDDSDAFKSLDASFEIDSESEAARSLELERETRRLREALEARDLLVKDARARALAAEARVAAAETEAEAALAEAAAAAAAAAAARNADALDDEIVRLRRAALVAEKRCQLDVERRVEETRDSCVAASESAASESATRQTEEAARLAAALRDAAEEKAALEAALELSLIHI